MPNRQLPSLRLQLAPQQQGAVLAVNLLGTRLPRLHQLHQ